MFSRRFMSIYFFLILRKRTVSECGGGSQEALTAVATQFSEPSTHGGRAVVKTSKTIYTCVCVCVKGMTQTDRKPRVLLINNNDNISFKLQTRGSRRIFRRPPYPRRGDRDTHVYVYCIRYIRF